MEKKDCGLLTAENGTMTVKPLSDVKIEWKQVSESFKEGFLEVYKDAYAILLADFDVNRGLNLMTILERIGNAINERKITKQDTFESVWEKETEAILVELEIA